MRAAEAGADVVPLAPDQMSFSEDPGENLAKAANRIERVWSEREVVGIPCGGPILGLGAVHCLSQQEP